MSELSIIKRTLAVENFVRNLFANKVVIINEALYKDVANSLDAGKVEYKLNIIPVIIENDVNSELYVITI